MATTSTLPAVYAALESLVRTAVNDASVGVTIGRPKNAEITRDAIYFGEATTSDGVPIMKPGRLERDERYTIETIIGVSLPRGTVADAITRAYVLRASLENVLADDKFLGLTSIEHATLQDGTMTPGYGNEGPVVVVTCGVRVVARLT